MSKINDILAKLRTQEDAFLRTHFLAPIAEGGLVQVRIAGAVCRMQVRPRQFRGWGVFKPASFTAATLVREAALAERQRYLRLFPAVRLILIEPVNHAWRAAPARLSDERFRIDGEVLVDGVEDAEVFDTAIARFDGSRFWFDEIDPQADPSASAYLREAITAIRHGRRLDRPGLTPEQRLAYAAVFEERLRLQQELARATDEGRLRTALEHAGGRLRTFSEFSDVYRVTYTVDGRSHTSVVQKNTLQVHSAGVCMMGQERKFDLESLVGILREGHKVGMDHGTSV